MKISQHIIDELLDVFQTEDGNHWLSLDDVIDESRIRCDSRCILRHLKHMARRGLLIDYVDVEAGERWFANATLVRH